MKRYFSSFLVVMLCYGLGLYSPAASAQSQRFDYGAVQKYVNSKGKKSVKDLVTKFENQLPSNMVEEVLKQSKSKAAANAWFDGASLGNNYAYMRVGKVKLVARTMMDTNGERVIMLNGIKITQNDFRDMKAVQGLVFAAYMKEALSKKGVFSYLFSPKVFAAGGEPQSNELATGSGKGGKYDTGGMGGVVSQCGPAIQAWQMIVSKPPQTAQEKEECNQKLQEAKAQCCSDPGMASGEMCKRNTCDGELIQAASEGGDNKWMWILGIGAAALLLFLLLGNKKKDKKPVDPPKPPPVDEEPEDETGVGRPPIMCQGAEANCGGNTTYPDPPTYTSPSESSGSSSSDPYPNTGSNSNLDSNSETSSGVGRGSQKTRARVKTK